MAQGGWGIQTVNIPGINASGNTTWAPGTLAGMGSGTAGAAGGTETTTSSSSTTRMSPGAEAALEKLIAELASGGTAEQRRQQAERNQEIQSVRGQRQDYSKEAAFADAEGAMRAQLANAMTASLAELARAAEGAGTSASAMRALLLQNAQQKAADSAATLGLQASANYGQIASGLSNTLEALTRPSDVVTSSLISALNVAKGVREESTTTTTGPAAQSRSSGGFGGGAAFVNPGRTSIFDKGYSDSFWKQFENQGSNLTGYGTNSGTFSGLGS